MFKNLVIEASVKAERHMVFKWDNGNLCLHILRIDNHNLAFSSLMVVNN